MWFDNPDSLQAKFVLAHENNLQGLAFWNFDSLDYSGSSPTVAMQTADMWQALDIFFAAGK